MKSTHLLNLLLILALVLGSVPGAASLWDVVRAAEPQPVLDSAATGDRQIDNLSGFLAPLMIQGSEPKKAAVGFSKHTIADFLFDGAQSVYAIDVDSDGDVDVLGAAYFADDIAWWENDGSENFVEHTIADNFDYAVSVYAIDVDSDGDVDVLGAAYSADDITWWENDGSENFAEHTIADNFNGAQSVYATDVDNDGDVDVLGAAYHASDITWWENDGSENFTEHTIADSFTLAASVYATDMDSDGDIDVLGASADAGSISDNITWWENDGSENFTGHTITNDFDGARSVYATDVDGDGDTDVLGAGESAGEWGTGEFAWWENDGNENFAKHTIADNLGDAWSVYATDVDGDGDVDVLGATCWSGYVSWWENDGNENFTHHIIDSFYEYARSVYATDVDGDGDVDVLGANDYYDDITWWEQGSGPLVFPTTLNFGTTLTELTLSVNPENTTDAWTLSENISWLTLSSISDTGSATVTVSVDRSGLSVGTYSDAINATVGSESVTVTATMDVTASDTTPPAAITDLSASTGSTSGTVELTWTAPGDDDNTDTASTYIVRYNTTQINKANWDSSTDVIGEPTPSLASSAESMTVSGLTPGQTYYFAIKTQDEVPNTSAISNSPNAMAATGSLPNPVTNLALRPHPSAGGKVSLSWLAPSATSQN